jgi:hypothetical protein
MRARADPDLLAGYRPAVDFAAARAEKITTVANEPEDAAARILAVLKRRRLPRRHVVGADAWRRRILAAVLPPAAREFVLSRKFGLLEVE